jgi:hypothetical protein
VKSGILQNASKKMGVLHLPPYTFQSSIPILREFCKEVEVLLRPFEGCRKMHLIIARGDDSKPPWHPI